MIWNDKKSIEKVWPLWHTVLWEDRTRQDIMNRAAANKASLSTYSSRCFSLTHRCWMALSAKICKRLASKNFVTWLKYISNDRKTLEQDEKILDNNSLHIEHYRTYPPTPALATAGAAPGTTAGVELLLLRFPRSNLSCSHQATSIASAVCQP